MNKKNFAFDKVNFILLAVSMCVIIFGFVLMSGGESTRDAYNPAIFDARHIKIAPVICFIGFISMIYAVVRKPKGDNTDDKGLSVKNDTNLKTK